MSTTGMTTLYMVRVALGVCGRCGNEREDPQINLCQVCKTRSNNTSAENRKSRIKRGLCIYCCKPRGVDGTKTMCRKCADKNGTRYQAWGDTNRAVGLCPRCGLRPIVKDRAHCAVCLLLSSEDTIHRKKMRIALGLCIRCGLREVADKKKSCQVCLDKNKVAYAEVCKRRES